jgi:hypothetical protein
MESERRDGALAMVMARRRGRKHANVGAFCDDHAGIRLDTNTGWHVAAVADGAGSAELSREGSRVAVKTALDAAPKLLAERVSPIIDAAGLDGVQSPDLVDALAESLAQPALDAAKAVARAAEAAKRPASALSTTLILGAARAIPGGWFFATFTVGDGLAAVWDAESGRVERMIAADSGDFAGQTHFLRPEIFRESVRTRLHHFRLPHFSAFALMSDGVSDARFPTAAAETDPELWGGLWSEYLAPILERGPDAPAALLEWLNFRVAGEHDDRSIVLIHPS